jgi:hypothetical protein
MIAHLAPDVRAAVRKGRADHPAALHPASAGHRDRSCSRRRFGAEEPGATMPDRGAFVRGLTGGGKSLVSGLREAFDAPRLVTRHCLRRCLPCGSSSEGFGRPSNQRGALRLPFVIPPLGILPVLAASKPILVGRDVDVMVREAVMAPFPRLSVWGQRENATTLRRPFSASSDNTGF